MFKFMHKKILLICMIMVMIFGGIISVQAVEPVKIFINGKEIQTDTPPKILNNRVFLPVRTRAENLNLDISWNELQRAVYINNRQSNTDRNLIKLNGELTTWPYWEDNGRLYMEYHNALELIRIVYNPIYEPVSYSPSNNILFIGNRSVDVNFCLRDGFRVLPITELKRLYILNYDWNSSEGNLDLKSF